MAIWRLGFGIGFGALGVVVASCGGSGSGAGPAACPDGGPCALGGAGGAGGTGGSAGAAGLGGGACPEIPANAAFCSASQPAVGTCTSPSPECNPNRPVHACCVAVGLPGKDIYESELARTTNTKEYSDPDAGPVDLGCFSPAGYPAKPSPGGTVTLTGRIRPAANGGCTEDDLLGTSIEIYPVVRTGDPATDGTPGALIGTGLVIDDSFPIVTEPVDNKCDIDLRYMRVYSYPGVPLDTELVVKTSGPGFTPLYTYNVYASASDPSHYDAASGSYEEDVLILAQDDFTTWSTVAIGKTISLGQGMVFGEVHDCGDIRLQNATVDVSAQRVALTYSDDNEDSPLTNGSNLGTGILSMFLALDVDPGFVRISAVGLLGDQLSSVGYVDARVFPDAATHVKLRGLRPFQVP